MSAEKNIAQMFEQGVVAFVKETAVLADSGMIGMSAAGHGKAAALVVCGDGGIKLFEKLLEIAPTLKEYADMMEERDLADARVKQVQEADDRSGK